MKFIHEKDAEADYIGPPHQRVIRHLGNLGLDYIEQSDGQLVVGALGGALITALVFGRLGRWW